MGYALGDASSMDFNASEVNQAIERGFAPWLASALETHGAVVTAENREGLKLAARAAALQARNLQQRLAEIVHLATERDIAVCLLKGAALEPWIYPGPGFRPMADVDLLVKPA
ncbi:MAG: nucleotidyltransferase family protein, partial [Gammaproteobacteria bacterium]